MFWLCSSLLSLEDGVYGWRRHPALCLCSPLIRLTLLLDAASDDLLFDPNPLDICGFLDRTLREMPATAGVVQRLLTHDELQVSLVTAP